MHPSIDDILTDHLTLEILSRLPIKAIINCKRVCKKWRDLVSWPYFARLHLSRSRQGLMVHRHCGVFKWVEIENKVNGRLALRHVKSLTNDLFRYRIQVNSVDGLICVYNVDWSGSTYIFNPIVGEDITLPKPQPRGLVTCAYGFGVSSAGEYKVIRICGKVSPSCPIPRKVSAVEIEVYTLGMDQWRSLGRTTSHLNLTRPLVLPGVFLDGHVYWIADMGQIYCFDLNKETDKIFPSPPEENQNQHEKQMLGVLKGRLSQFSWSSSGFTLWLMKESWCKVMVITQENINPCLRLLEWTPWCLVDGLEGNTTAIICVTETGKMVAYCLNTNTIVKLRLRGFFMRAMTYRPSFLRLQNFGSHSL